MTRGTLTLAAGEKEVLRLARRLSYEVATEVLRREHKRRQLEAAQQPGEAQEQQDERAGVGRRDLRPGAGYLTK